MWLRAFFRTPILQIASEAKVRRHLLQFGAFLLLLVCLCGHIAETFDFWDHTLQTGNDIRIQLGDSGIGSRGQLWACPRSYNRDARRITNVLRVVVVRSFLLLGAAAGRKYWLLPTPTSPNLIRSHSTQR